MKRFLGKAVVIALAAVIVGGATAAFAASGFWNGNSSPGGRYGYVSQKPGVSRTPGSGLRRPGKGRKHFARIAGTVSSINGNTIVVGTKRGQITVTLDGKVRIVEIRTSLEPIGVKVGQHVVLIGRRTKKGPRVHTIVVRAGKPNNKPADEPGGATQPNGVLDGAIGL